MRTFSDVTVPAELPKNIFDMTSNTQSKEDIASLQVQLRLWVLENKVPRTTVNKLLIFLSQHVLHPLPLDYRSLMGTPRLTLKRVVPPGHYVHLGFEKGILHLIHTFLEPCHEEMNFQLHIDDMGITKSGKSQVWPTQARITQPFLSTPFVVGVYSGLSKPELVTNFLSDVISELAVLLKDGLILPISNRKVCLKLTEIICDISARTFVQQSMSHNGYWGCDKCEQKGTYSSHKMVYESSAAILRTDSSFRQNESRKKSPLGVLPIDMIDCFPIDPMHSVYLGVSKRLLHL